MHFSQVPAGRYLPSITTMIELQVKKIILIYRFRLIS